MNERGEGDKFLHHFLLHMEEVNSMEYSSSDKETIQHQYDAWAKKTLKGAAKNYQIELAKRAAREISFSDLSESELGQLFTIDEYKSDYFCFQVSGFDVNVKNELLAEALSDLSKMKRDIVLLSYFFGMERCRNWQTVECCTQYDFSSQKKRTCENQTVFGGKNR